MRESSGILKWDLLQVTLRTISHNLQDLMSRSVTKGTREIGQIKVKIVLEKSVGVNV